MGNTKSTPISISLFIFILGLISFYVIVYQTYPFPDPWNDISLNADLAFSAILAAIMASGIFFNYHPEDSPRLVWKWFAIGAWSWAIAEATWGVLAFFNAEVPTPSTADIFWFLGFVFFSIGLYEQYKIIYPQRTQTIITNIIAIWAICLIIPYFISDSTGETTLISYIDYWYAGMDISVGIAGIFLMVSFRGGVMMRPWIGMIIFGISDFMYAWAVQSGLYAWSSETGNPITLIIDTLYLAAYLILAFGFWGQWALLKYGTATKVDASYRI